MARDVTAGASDSLTVFQAYCAQDVCDASMRATTMTETSPMNAPKDDAASANDDAELHKKAARGGLWTLLGFGTGQVLRLGGNLVLTRLLPREAFGVMLLVQVVLQGLERFSDVGVGPAIIQNEREDRTFLDTAWTLQSVRGVILMTCAGALAYPVALFYDQPILALLIPFSGLSALFSGLQSTKLHTANRRLMVGRVTLVNLLGQMLGLVVTMIWAFASPSVWALAAGGVMSALSMSVLSHLIIGGTLNQFAWDRDSARTVMNFGKWVFISTLLSFFSTQSDRIVFGRLFDLSTLGIYAIASLIAEAPQQLLRRLTLRVDFPLYSQTLRSGRDVAPVFQRARRRVMVLGGLAAAGLVAGGPPLIEVLYPEAYLAAGWMVQIMAIALWFNTMSATIESVFLAQSFPRMVATSNLVKVASMLVGMLVGYQLAELTGALWGLAASEICRYAYLRFRAEQSAFGGIRQEVLYTGFVAASSLGGILAVAAIKSLGLPAIAQALAMALLVVGAWVPIALPQLRRGTPAQASK